MLCGAQRSQKLEEQCLLCFHPTIFLQKHIFNLMPASKYTCKFSPQRKNHIVDFVNVPNVVEDVGSRTQPEPSASVWQPVIRARFVNLQTCD